MEAALDPKFNLHGVSATTMGATPCIIVSGCTEAEVTSAHGCLGASGHRSNATIGRALKLILHNVGGARLSGTESTTLGSPAKYSFCFAEIRDTPWGAYATSDEDVVTTIATTSGPVQTVDFSLTDPRALVKWLAAAMVHAGYSPKLAWISDCLVCLSPEHFTLLSTKYKTREAFKVALWTECNAAITPHVFGS